ncbi:hypothetical protein PR003_g11451, partial [Phytophthora rubi]
MACAVVFLASGHALSETTNADQATVSKLAPLELGASIDAVTSENKKRSLRSHRAMDEDDDEEERYDYVAGPGQSVALCSLWTDPDGNSDPKLMTSKGPSMMDGRWRRVGIG